MNAFELQKLIEKAVRSPLDKLSLAEIQKVGRALQQALDKLESISQKETILSLEHSIRQEDRALFDSLRKAEAKTNKDRLDTSRRAKERCENLASQLRPTLEKLGHASEAEAMAVLGTLSKEQLDWLSLLANVSDAEGKLLKYSPRKRVQWLTGLGIKVSGVAVAKRKKGR